MGFEVTCSKCKGTGIVGIFATSRCHYCSGTGKVVLGKDKGATAEMLYEFFEGLLDEDTEDEWLVKQMMRLIKQRKAERKK